MSRTLLSLGLTAMFGSLPVPASATEVACYYFPNWGEVERSEWRVVMSAPKRFEGHRQPKRPLWGYQNEQHPEVMARKIDAASDNGIDAFLFCHYHSNAGPFLRDALDRGFLRAKNNGKIRFALLWANHDIHAADYRAAGEVLPATFEDMVDECLDKYFAHPSYWRVGGKPYFSIYKTTSFLESFGGITGASTAIARFRQRAIEKGYPGVHINLVLWGMPSDPSLPHADLIEQLKADSVTSYTWIHYVKRNGFPTSDYGEVRDRYFDAIERGGEANGLQSSVTRLGVPYYPTVIMGWDSSPRCRTDKGWDSKRSYPFGSVITGNTPANFRQALQRAKDYAEKSGAPVVTINAWNEWGEGSYLEPELGTEMSYLEAVRDVFADRDG